MPRPPSPGPPKGAPNECNAGRWQCFYTRSNPKPVAGMCSTLGGHGGHCRPGGYASCALDHCWVSMQGPRSLAAPTPARTRGEPMGLTPGGVHTSGGGPEDGGWAGKTPPPPFPAVADPFIPPKGSRWLRLGWTRPPVWIDLGGGWLDGVGEGRARSGTEPSDGPPRTAVLRRF